jgi:hypothetical protein
MVLAPIVNIELNENMGFAYTIPPSRAQRVSSVGGHRIHGFKSRATLQVENLALRHQLGVLRRSVKRPKLTSADRLLWAWLSESWSDWRPALVIVKPETVIGWHREAVKLFWTWKTRRGQPGRPPVPKDVRELIRRMSRENSLWGAPRIHGELLKLGIDIGETSVRKYLVRTRKPPSQTWRTFLENHVKAMVSVDFFTVPTIRFQVLYVFLVLAHDRRRIVPSPPIRQPSGPRSNCGRPFRLIRSLDTCCGTATAFTPCSSIRRCIYECLTRDQIVGVP